MSDQSEFYVTQTGMVIDPKRIDTFDKFLFRPFVVKSTQPLAQALAKQQIKADRDVLMAKVTDGTIILDKPQMSYYHTAQGEFKGQPWLVCF